MCLLQDLNKNLLPTQCQNGVAPVTNFISKLVQYYLTTNFFRSNCPFSSDTIMT